MRLLRITRGLCTALLAIGEITVRTVVIILFAIVAVLRAIRA